MTLLKNINVEGYQDILIKFKKCYVGNTKTKTKN